MDAENLSVTKSYASAWQQMWRSLGVAGADPALLHALLGRYSEPHRSYHTLRHLDACFANFATLRGQATYPAEVELALWFHDAVYETAVPGNEQASADWAAQALLAAGGAHAAAQRVHALVMTTCHDRVPQTADEKILLDVDLAILGSTSGAFDAYELQVREEYAAVPINQFRARRRRILQQFLERERIYHTGAFHGSHEAQARANLLRSIGQLSEDGSRPAGKSN